jgi:hypothetical protein
MYGGWALSVLVFGGFPTMVGEAPPGYVAFVARHLDRLRRDAARVMGDVGDADRLYPEVLTDVAARWNWLELSRTWLGRPGAADSYLRTAFARRSQRWQAGWQAEPGAEPGGPPGAEPSTVSDIHVLRPGELPPPLRALPRSSAAARQAAYLRPPPRTEVGPLAEAAIAWWHAYELYRRRLMIAALVVLFVILVAALHLQQVTESGGS